MNRYLIIGQMRSGTTVTHLCLKGHPEISALNDEIKVEPFFTQGLSVFTHGNDLPEEKVRGPLVLYDALAGLCATPKVTAWGMKTAISSLTEAKTLIDSLRNGFPGLKIIHTQRDDIVAQYGSLLRAEATGQWHSWSKPIKDPLRTISLLKGKLAQVALQSIEISAALNTLKETHDFFDVSYERDLLPNDMLVFRRLFAFLGVSDVKIDWLNSTKVAPHPQSYIEDYLLHVDFVNMLKKCFDEDPEQARVLAEKKSKKLWHSLKRNN